MFSRGRARSCTNSGVPCSRASASRSAPLSTRRPSATSRPWRRHQVGAARRCWRRRVPRCAANRVGDIHRARQYSPARRHGHTARRDCARRGRAGRDQRTSGDRIRERVRTLGHRRPHRTQEPLRDRGDLVHGGVERLGVAGGWLSKAADLAHVLEGGGLRLTGGCGSGLVGPTELADASAHAPQGTAPGPGRRARALPRSPARRSVRRGRGGAAPEVRPRAGGRPRHPGYQRPLMLPATRVAPRAAISAGADVGAQKGRSGTGKISRG